MESHGNAVGADLQVAFDGIAGIDRGPEGGQRVFRLLRIAGGHIVQAAMGDRPQR